MQKETKHTHTFLAIMEESARKENCVYARKSAEKLSVFFFLFLVCFSLFSQKKLRFFACIYFVISLDTQTHQFCGNLIYVSEKFQMTAWKVVNLFS
jgi:hypothetical protein